MNYYCIVPTDEITQDMVNESTMNAADIRYSVDGASAILKFDKQFPNTMFGYNKFTHSEILSVITGVAWAEAE